MNGLPRFRYEPSIQKEYWVSAFPRREEDVNFLPLHGAFVFCGIVRRDHCERFIQFGTHHNVESVNLLPERSSVARQCIFGNSHDVKLHLWMVRDSGEGRE